MCFDFFNSYKLFNVIIYCSKYSIYPENNYYICYSCMEYLQMSISSSWLLSNIFDDCFVYLFYEVNVSWISNPNF